MVLHRRAQSTSKGEDPDGGTLICVVCGSYDIWNLITLFESVDKDGTVISPSYGVFVPRMKIQPRQSGRRNYIEPFLGDRL